MLPSLMRLLFIGVMIFCCHENVLAQGVRISPTNIAVGVDTVNIHTAIHATQGGLLLEGTTGSTPISGAGMRMMWIPEKGAFRAGFVNGTQWDADSIGNYSFIGGGTNNTASGFTSFVGGGQNNTVSASYSFVGGGANNNASGLGSFVGGGTINTASGSSSFVSGGFSNTASGSRSFVGGGQDNTASGSYSYVGGGLFNTAPSYGEAVLGVYTETYPMGHIIDDNNWKADDRIFSIGNGTFEERSNAMTVLKNGKIGVGTTTPTTLLDIQGNSDSTNNLIRAKVNYQGNTDIIAVEGISQPIVGWGYGVAGRGGFVGVYGVAAVPVGQDDQYTEKSYGGYFANHLRGSGDKYGVVGIVTDFSINNTKYGVYGDAVAQTNSWAGYFAGNVGYTGTLSMVSDRRLKRDATDLEGALAKVMALEPKTYTFRRDEYPHLNLAQGQQIGFISQEVAAVLPEITHDYVAAVPDHDNPKASTNTPIKGMNYLAIIPVLTGAIQEQQEVIVDLNTEITDLSKEMNNQQLENETLRNELDDLRALVEQLLEKQDQQHNTPITLNQVPALQQNEPNPTSGMTRVGYFLPEGKSGELRINSISGQELQRIPLPTVGAGHIDLQTRNLPAGTYTYSLIVDDQLIDTKRMIRQF